jgi:hypothetical protein
MENVLAGLRTVQQGGGGDPDAVPLASDPMRISRGAAETAETHEILRTAFTVATPRRRIPGGPMKRERGTDGPPLSSLPSVPLSQRLMIGSGLPSGSLHA